MSIAFPSRPAVRVHSVRRSSFGGAVALKASLALALAVSATTAVAAGPANRLRADARLADRAEMQQPVSGRLAVSTPLGSIDGATALQSMSLVLAPSAAQTAALDQLLADQQNPSSSRYHQWLTPSQFGAQFGVSDADLLILKNWLTSQGFEVQGVPESRNAIQFSGTAANLEAAFHPNLQRFEHNGQRFLSNTAVPTLPAAFQGVVAAVQGLSTYHLQPHARLRPLTAEEAGSRLHADSTGTNSAGAIVHELVPYDVRQIYSASSLVSSGYTGTGVTIAVIGQTAVNTTQLGYFQTLTGQTVLTPTLTLVPNTGVSTVRTGDEFEAEADIEYASGVAPGAAVNFIYTGSSTNADVFTALQYAITTNAGSIVTLSYGGCELLSGSDAATLEPYLRQASAQGQTFLNSSGDSGAANCDSDGLSTVYDGLSASYPASSPNTTGVGGTTLNDATGNYWAATNNSQNGSALGYIPEVVWNDSNSTNIGASGGGASVLFGKPAWQAGTGVPADGARDVPDVSFSAGSNHDPYILCSGDASATYTTSTGAVRTAACTATSGGYYAVGGTSLSSPSFAGLLALVEQANGGKRLGNINPTLYALAASTPAVFNDITTGTTALPCLPGTPGCVNGLIGYPATTGYDLATGLGSINIATLSGAVAAAAATTAKVPTVTVQQTSNTTSSDSFVISVAPVSSTTVATGTVSVAVDGGTATTLTLAGGAANFAVTVSGLAAGTHTLRAVYSGDGNYTTATTSFNFTTGRLVGTFTLSVNPTTLTVATGAAGTATVSLTSTGYTGIVLYTVAPAAGSAAAPGCFTGANGDYTTSTSNLALDTAVSAGSTVTAAIKYHAVTTGCSTLSQLAVPNGGAAVFTASHTTGNRHLPWAAFAFGGFLVGGLSLRRRQAGLVSGGLLAVAFSIAVLGAAGCGSGTAALATSPTSSSATYQYVVTATSYPSGNGTGIAATTASANLTITVQ